jgi:hypothetical protein
MSSADEAGFVRVVLDKLEIDVDVVGLQERPGTPDGKFADSAAAKTAAEDDRFGIRPRLIPEEALDYRVQRLGMILDGAEDDAGGFDRAARQEFVELLLADVGGFGIAERVFA